MTWIRPSRAALVILLALCACEEQGSVERYQSQAPVEPLHLWSISVVEQERETAQVTLCANPTIRAGFTTPLPMTDGRACARIGADDKALAQGRMRCVLNGRTFDVRAFTRGEPTKDFYVDFRMRSVDAERLVLRQTRHYRLLGACPSGWIAGDNTDRFGQRRVNALR